MGRLIAIDAGNSEIVAAVYNGDEREAILRTPLDSSWDEWLVSFVDDQREMGEVAIGVASVQQGVSEAIPDLIPDAHRIDATNAKIKLDVEMPGEVGADRIANAYGANFLHKGENCIIVDVGSAISFDAIKEGAFIGGAIAPGLTMMAHSLHSGTSLLPYIEVHRPREKISRSTTGNLTLGIYSMALGGIARTLDVMKEELPDAVTIATGGSIGELGDSELAEDLSQIVDHLEPELTLIGIREILSDFLDSEGA